MRCIARPLALAALLAGVAVPALADPRPRDLGIPFSGVPGHFDAITDVPGVEVGYKTIISSDTGPHAARTGVTAILPRGRNGDDPVFAASVPLNGVGELTGTGFIEEEGFLEGPIAITNSLSIGAVRDGVSDWLINYKKFSNICCLPVVGETWDGYLNDIAGFHVKPGDAIEAIKSAHSGPIEEGNVGGGTGMMLFGFKGGNGTASRVVQLGTKSYTLGVFVQGNFGERNELRVGGIPIGDQFPGAPSQAYLLHPGLNRDVGSIIIVVATDAPLLPHQLKRIAKRVAVGLARTGSILGDLSGDIAIAFSTANPGILGVTTADPDRFMKGGVQSVDMLANSQIEPLFTATADATEEAVINALFAAKTMVGQSGSRAEAIDHKKVLDILAKHGLLTK